MSDGRYRASADGTGALLGLAAADQLAALQRSLGARTLYGFATQVATVASYHLMKQGRADADRFRSELLEMAFGDDGPNAYRDQPDWFRRWLESAGSGGRAAAQGGEGAAFCSLPVGVWYRWQADDLIIEAANLARATHDDAVSVAVACAYAGAVAAASFGQFGTDYLNGVFELTERAVGQLEQMDDLEDRAGLARVRAAVGSSGRLQGGRSADVVARCLEELGRAGLVLAAVVLAGAADSEDVVRSAATLPSEGASVAPLAGGIIGARRGLAHWPWEMPNEHWFAEIGRRLVARSRTYEDLPDPYAVEVSMIDPSWAPHRIF